MQSVGQKKTKTFHEHCNATITRVLNTSGTNNKIKLILYIYIYMSLAIDTIANEDFLKHGYC